MPKADTTITTGAAPATTLPDQANGVTGQMMEAGVEAFLQAGYLGITLNRGGDQPLSLDSQAAVGLALSRAFPAMLDMVDASARDTLAHPGPIGGDDPTAWAAMPPCYRAQYVLHQAPAHLLGIAAMLAGQRTGNPGFDAGLAFLADAVTALARQMERAAAVQRREQEQRRAAWAAEAERQRMAKPKRTRKPIKRKKGSAAGSAGA